LTAGNGDGALDQGSFDVAALRARCLVQVRVPFREGGVASAHRGDIE
jgi:hypothetical protein